jgi:hypothetical protein
VSVETKVAVPIFGVKVQLPKLNESPPLEAVTVASALVQDSVNPACEKSVSVSVRPGYSIDEGL